MERLTEKYLREWKDSPRRKPLIIRGARQVGKTWLVENCMAAQYESFVKIDLEQRPDLHVHFQSNLEPKRILDMLEATTGPIVPGNTLLFLDEIQTCPRAITALRYFYEQMPELHLVVAGSMLEFAFAEVSVPVGRVQYLHLHPMTFYEYLVAIGKESMARMTLDPKASAHREILAELKRYFFVGGMPECVKVYRDRGSMAEVFQVQSEIIESYRDDFAKYKPHVDSTCLDAVLLNVARRVGQQIKYAGLDADHTGPTNRKAFDSLVKAKVVHKISSCNPPGLPLGASANPKKFKAALLDIGLMQRLCRVPVEAALQEQDLLSIYRGMLAEQFVAQEMIAWQTSPLYYWSREKSGSSAEVDYLAVREGLIYPVEVKSGAGGRMRSLHVMLEKYPDLPEGLVLHSGPYEEMPRWRLVAMPLYCAATTGDKRPEINLQPPPLSPPWC